MNDNLGELNAQSPSVAFTAASVANRDTPILLNRAEVEAGFASAATHVGHQPNNYVRMIDAHWWVIVLALGAVLWAIILSLV